RLHASSPRRSKINFLRIFSILPAQQTTGRSVRRARSGCTGRTFSQGGVFTAEQRPQKRSEAVEIHKDDGRGKQRQRLAENQSTNNRDAQRTVQLRASARA